MRKLTLFIIIVAGSLSATPSFPSDLLLFNAKVMHRKCFGVLKPHSMDVLTYQVLREDMTLGWKTVEGRITISWIPCKDLALLRRYKDITFTGTFNRETHSISGRTKYGDFGALMESIGLTETP